MTADMIYEHLKLEKSIVIGCVEYYCVGIIEYFRAEFLHRSTVVDTQCLLAKTEECEFSGMLVSINCMH
jgi:hypothetical protein